MSTDVENFRRNQSQTMILIYLSRKNIDLIGQIQSDNITVVVLRSITTIRYLIDYLNTCFKKIQYT